MNPQQFVFSYGLVLATILFCCVIALSVAVLWLLRERQRRKAEIHENSLIFDRSSLRILFKDDQNRILRLNEPAARFMGHTADSATGKSGYELFPKVAKRLHDEDLEAIKSGEARLGEIKDLGSVAEVEVWGYADKIPYKDPTTGEDRILVIAADVTEQVKWALDLRHIEERFNLAIEMSSIGTWDWNILSGENYWSPRMKEIVGIDADAPVRGPSIFEGRLHPDDVERVLDARSTHLNEKVPYSIEYRLRHENGEYVWVRTRGQAVWDDAGNPTRMAGTVEEITERVALEQRLAFLAHHDPLTGLSNRTFFAEQLDAALNRARRGEGFALFFLDLDGFKNVNDTLGHAAGDEMLKAVSDELRNCVREIDTIARMGGDEFAIIQASTETVEEVEVLAERILKTIGSAKKIDNTQLVLGCSIGIAIAPGEGSDAVTLMRNADIALYRAKQDGRGIYRHFDASMRAGSDGRQMLGAEYERTVSDK
jgi:diguanylate cyclase (GGDEF)-like protein/PAS domain S-box-containing protein